MSTMLEPGGEEEHESTTLDLVGGEREDEDASMTLEVFEEVHESAMLEIPGDESTDPTGESAEQVGKTPELALPSPSPLYLLPAPASTTRESADSPLHEAAPPGSPASQALLSTDLLRRPAPATLPLAPRPSSHIPLLPGPAPVMLSPAAIGPDVALPSPGQTDPPPATPGPTTLASEEPPFPPAALELAPAMPAPTPEAPAPPLPTLEMAPAMPEPPFRPATPPLPATPPESAAITSAPAAIASALGAIVSAHVSSTPSPARVRATSAPARRTSPPTTPRPAPASVPTRRRPVQRRSAPVRRRPVQRQRRSWLGTSIKVALLAIELPLTLMLATYAGVIPLLPSTPPAVQVAVAGAGAAVQARQSLYCWFTPGQARCSAPNALPAQALPELTVHQDGVLQFRFSYPAPTTCTASIPDGASILGAMKPLGALLAQNDGMALAARTYRLRVTLAPGTYSVDVSCRWHPPQTLRWLQGQGESSYWIALRVLPA